MASVKRDFSRPFDYTVHGRKIVLVLTRVKGATHTDACNFCGLGHRHSPQEGHRAAHCEHPHKKTREFILHPDGFELFREDGYFIKNISR